jgi:hypothetical protein
MGDLMESNEWLGTTYRPCATYFGDSDCVEYVNEDVVCVYSRIDEFLTLIYDDTRIRVIGFKLKGFRFFFERMKAHLELNNAHFIKVVALIEEICRDIGDDLIADNARQRAYMAARKIAEKESVELYDLPLAA